MGPWSVSENLLEPFRKRILSEFRNGPLMRPAFEQLRRALFDGTIKTVVLWKLDRLSRRQREGVNLLADWCEHRVPRAACQPVQG